VKTWETACPAKVNLFLAVGPPDARGYHPLRTIFEAISLSDKLRVSIAESGPDYFVVTGPPIPDENTLTKTLRLVRELLPVPPLRIELEKNIPSEAGLGGGSSDAAGLLRILMRMMHDHFEERFAFEVAEAVGADVSFFLVGGQAKGEGYGQILTPLPDKPSAPLIVVMPAVTCSTPEAFRRLDAAPREWRPFPEEDLMGHFGFNDFEAVAPPVCRDIINYLEGQDYMPGLAGSGSAVYAFGEPEDYILRHLRARGHWVMTARTLTRSESLEVSSS
jgi:4-diphosphocytidyl-2-C-methyl-D-erythritol kinase